MHQLFIHSQIQKLRMVAVMLPTERKPVEIKKPSIIDENWPCFVTAFTMASMKLALAYTGTEDLKISGFSEFQSFTSLCKHNISDDVNVFFLMELGSTPLAIINPRVWFGMFMCSLAYMSVETGYPTVAILTIGTMLIISYSLEYADYRKQVREEESNYYKVLPLVDEEKLKKQEMV